jgi:hypothetical protein
VATAQGRDVYVSVSRYCNIDLCEGSYVDLIFTSERPSEAMIHQSESARPLCVAALAGAFGFVAVFQ